MANYAHVENNQIVGVYDNLPNNWKNISNFYVLSEEELYPLGWRVVVKDIPVYDSNQFKIDNPVHELIDDVVYEKYDIIPLHDTNNVSETLPALTPEELLEKENERLVFAWRKVRDIREGIMRDFEWRYTRYYRQQRLNIPTSDTLENLDAYMQALADITNQPDPYNIVWPSYES